MNRTAVLGLACFACSRAAPIAAPAAPPSLRITSPAEQVAPGVAATQYSEIRLAVSPDGALMLWGSVDRPGGPGGWNVWLARRQGAGWSAPEPAPLNSDANDFDPAFSPDGRWVYWFSNRPGGAGGDDIYRAPLGSDGFGPAEHLGPEINTPGDEWAPALSPDGKRLLFATSRPGKRHDLMIAELRGSGFAPAAPLPGAINTGDDEFDATFLADGATIVFSRSTDVEKAPIALYIAGLGPSGYDAGVPLPTAVNVTGGYTLGPAIDWADRSVLYFSGIRPEANAGRMDPYRVRYTLDPR